MTGSSGRWARRTTPHPAGPADQSRRRLLAGLATLPVAAGAGGYRASAQAPRNAPPPIRRPRRLSPGDTVGIVAPASAVWNPVRVDIAVESIAALGLKATVGRHVLDRRGYFSGDDRARAEDVNGMFADPTVRAIHALHGGWGSARLLPLLDFDAIAKDPKILIGYSDITALLLPIHARTGLVTFHGPVGASRWNSYNVDYFRRVLMEGDAVRFENYRDIGDNLTQVEDRVRTITPGTARGRLVGGNLTVLTSLVGTPWLPSFDGAILFVEDIDEEPYRIDRMLTQLSLAGLLRNLAGFVFGRCTRCDPGEGFGSLTIPDILDDHIRPLGIPAYDGAQIGHVERQFTLPIGAEVELDASAGTLRMLAPAVV